MNSTNCYCSFCASLGIKGPHDHWLRTSRKAGGTTCCPKLLATECNFCKRKGHTVKFCGERQDQERLRNQEVVRAKRQAINNGEWMTTAQWGRQIQLPTVKQVTPMNNSMVARFAALELEECSSSDEKEKIHPVEVEEPVTEWADVVKKRSVKFDVPERQALKTALTPRAAPALVQEDSNDELPPLIFGRRGTTCWADAV